MLDFRRGLIDDASRKLIKRVHFPLEVVLTGVRWCRAVDREGDAVDFLPTAKRETVAARRFLVRAINLHDLPEKVTIGKSDASTAAIESVKADACVNTQIRQCKYLNNIVEQDHRAIKRIARPILCFKTFRCARIIIAGIETMHMIHKGQIDCLVGQAMSPADQFYTLAI